MMRTPNFKSAFVKSGTKVKNESEPILTLTPSHNGFRLNNLAMKTLGITQKDRVVMFSDFDPNELKDQTERYYIAKGFELDGVEQGAKVGVQNAFTYSDIWGSMLANDNNLQSVDDQGLIDRGLMIANAKGTKIAVKSLTAELVPYQNGEPVEVMEGVELPLYQLTNFKFKDHTPKSNTRTGDYVEEEMFDQDED